ncbi:RNA 2',3'-cyclic phosphodiesterase [Thaumasiovibrio sp. DFM-14]|uniref:RNA 2',3'-cyclic phosphodiesterase n=1 Tax=Thaumasiovibrio sp. DFM-14 TaxID=3384792 RepID=UPI00399F4921
MVDNPSCFIALPLSKSLCHALASLQIRVPAVRWMPIANFHLTLCFIGNVPTEGLLTQLRLIRLPCFEIVVNHVGSFSTSHGRHVLWAGIAESHSLLRLQHAVEWATVITGIEPEVHRFYPHITLGRTRRTHYRDTIKPFLQQKINVVEQCRQFVLYASDPQPQGGSRYVPIQRFELV